jgi:hypothetical protein
MAGNDSSSLKVAILAIRAEINKYESLLTSGAIKNPRLIRDLLDSLQEAAQRLNAAYIEEQKSWSNLPDSEQLIKTFSADKKLKPKLKATAGCVAL